MSNLFKDSSEAERLVTSKCQSISASGEVIMKIDKMILPRFNT